MRELFRAVVKDGDISDADRLMLQNVATLLSQVEGNTWVSFADTHGSVQELTAPQVKRLRPFLENVARDLKEHEVQCASLDSRNEEVLDCLQLAAVGWAEGITANELLSCCGPEGELIFEGWLGRATAVLPSQYMIRTRVRELLNHYYLKRHHGEGRRRLSLLERTELVPVLRATVAPIRWCSCTASTAVRTGAAPVVCLARGVLCLSRVATGSVASAFVTAATAVVDLASAVMPKSHSQEPLWPALRFFVAAFLHSQLRKLFKVLVLITSWRVVLCLAACSENLGWLFHPVVWIAEKVLHWKSSSRVWGCGCGGGGDDPSVLSWIPVKLSHTMVDLMGLARNLPMPGDDVDIFLLLYVRPVLSFILDFTFSVGIAKGLAALVDLADESAQEKLVWMSMHVSRIIREGPREESRPLLPSRVPEPQAPSSTQTAGPQSPGPMNWNEEGTWNLFDS